MITENYETENEVEFAPKGKCGENLIMKDYMDYGKYNSGRFVSQISGRARRKMFQCFMEYASPAPESRCLDVGVTPDNEGAANNFFEKMYPWTGSIIMCSVEDAGFLEREFLGSKFVQNEPGKALPFKDGQFDVVFCSAVLEHVGDYKAQEFFLKELVRVGRKVFLTTPNRWFPVEVHTVLPFIHWLPQPVHQKILRLLGKDFFAQTENLNLLDKKRLSRMLQSVSIPVHWVFSSYRLFGLPSNIILYIERDGLECVN